MGFREVLQDPAIRKLSAAQFVSLLGDFLAIYAVLSVVSFKMHATPAEVAGVLIFYMLPMAFVSPLAGVFVDRWDVRYTMICSDLIRGGLILLLLRATHIWEIYAVLAAISAVSSFFTPAQSIAIRSIVPKEGLMSANAMMMQIMQVTQIASPAITGQLITWFGESSCFVLDAVSFVASAGIVASMPIVRAGGKPERKAGSVIADMTSGVKFIFTHSVLAFTIISMAAGLFAVRCYSALIAVYVRDILHLHQAWFGTLGSLVGIGMLVGTIVVNHLAKTRSKGHMMMSGLFGVAAGVLILALVSSLPVAAVATLGIGFSVALIVISAQTMMQGQTPMEMMGRVTSSLMSVLSLAQVAGLMMSGAIAQAIGIRGAYLITAGLLALIGAVGWRKVEQRKAAEA